MRVNFIGNPLDPDDARDVCQLAGKSFVKGGTVDVSDLTEDMQRRLAGNRHFEVVGAAEDKPKRGRPRKDRDEDVSDGE